MKTAIWKVTLKEWTRDDFINGYDLFKDAPGFINCHFYPVIGEANTLFAVETWESDEAHDTFMGSMTKETMGEIFSRIEGRPEVYDCEIGKIIEK